MKKLELKSISTKRFFITAAVFLIVIIGIYLLAHFITDNVLSELIPDLTDKTRESMTYGISFVAFSFIGLYIRLRYKLPERIERFLTFFVCISCIVYVMYVVMIFKWCSGM